MTRDDQTPHAFAKPFIIRHLCRLWSAFLAVALVLGLIPVFADVSAASSLYWAVLITAILFLAMIGRLSHKRLQSMRSHRAVISNAEIRTYAGPRLVERIPLAGISAVVTFKAGQPRSVELQDRYGKTFVVYGYEDMPGILHDLAAEGVSITRADRVVPSRAI